MILQYIGKSFFPSKFIQWFTWGKYSHSAWSFCEIEAGMLVGDISEYEAWAGKGVVHVPAIGLNHTKGTRIDLYDLKAKLNNKEASEGLTFLTEQIGKGYDYKGILGFILRKKSLHNPYDWFCSELVFAFLLKCGRFLLHGIKPYQVSPQMLPLCPDLVYLGYIIAGEDLKIRQDIKEDSDGNDG